MLYVITYVRTLQEMYCSVHFLWWDKFSPRYALYRLIILCCVTPGCIHLHVHNTGITCSDHPVTSCYVHHIYHAWYSTKLRDARIGMYTQYIMVMFTPFLHTGCTMTYNHKKIKKKISTSCSLQRRTELFFRVQNIKILFILFSACLIVIATLFFKGVLRKGVTTHT